MAKIELFWPRPTNLFVGNHIFVGMIVKFIHVFHPPSEIVFFISCLVQPYQMVTQFPG